MADPLQPLAVRAVHAHKRLPGIELFLFAGSP